MDYNFFFEEIQNKYNYDEKIITALEKIVPKVVSYYGLKYRTLIEEALLNCLIIYCNSKETINIVISREKQIDIKKDKSLIGNDLSSLGGVYYSYPIIGYDTNINSYVINGIKRYIIISHTHNLDSAMGIAVLTHNICHLIKSYMKEYKLVNNTLIRRSGLSFEQYLIETKDTGIVIDLLKDENIGLEEGINSYDEEEIVKMVLDDNYETFDYKNTKYIGLCLKDRLNLKNVINKAEIDGDVSLFVQKYGIHLFKDLSILADQSCELEDKKNNYEITKEELNFINSEINYLIPKIVDNMTIYLNKSY